MRVTTTPQSSPQLITPDSVVPGSLWSYLDPGYYYQAWMGPLHSDTGYHYNFHVQPAGGGSDMANYHIYYKGIDVPSHTRNWQTYENIAGVTAYYSYSSYASISDAALGVSYDFASLLEEYYSGIFYPLFNPSYGYTLDYFFETLTNY